MADCFQFAAIHAVITCPLGPRIRFFAGRKDGSRGAPDGLLPGGLNVPDTLLSYLKTKPFSHMIFLP
ncbi:hypothetical protein CC78DRAFT_530369 [Lojkania enalia]|uniref:Uncharacterized protein n=1 Tax=Lojkania enalia TaxID=147567 RepID=A0A9P4KH63_9PLEO|nr:hypothetical protein CC78DRAFT_530369 [Didymosphaeria enalia]